MSVLGKIIRISQWILRAISGSIDIDVGRTIQRTTLPIVSGVSEVVERAERKSVMVTERESR